MPSLSNFDNKLNKAISAKEEHSRHYDRLLAAQTTNFTAEIKNIASLADDLKNYDSKFAEIDTAQTKMRDTNDLKFQKMADKIASLQD